MFSAATMTNFSIAMEIMGLGMFGIFTVILLIMAIVFGLSKIGSKGDN